MKNKISTRSLISSIGVTTFFLLSLIVFSLLIVFSFVFIKQHHSSEKAEQSYTNYKYLEVDQSGNKSPWGMVQLPYTLEDEYISYQNEGKYVLISSIGSDDRYKCTGSCYCDQNQESRRASAAISRGFTYLLVSLTAILAVTKAREVFEDECKILLKDDNCQSNSIQSVVEDCQNLDADEREGDGTDTDDDECMKEFVCMGKCRDRSFSKIPSEAEEQKKQRNEVLAHWSYGIGYCTNLQINGHRLDVDCSDTKDQAVLEARAVEMFKEKMMKKFCTSFGSIYKEDFHLFKFIPTENNEDFDSRVCSVSETVQCTDYLP